VSNSVLQVIGGIGLFIFGMSVMTDGLKSLAGESMRRFLARFTRTPLTGFLSGLGTTAIIQSSTATTVMAVGFVGAGLMTFPQALGIIFGANIGTTITGWLVAFFGLTLQLSIIALPLVFVGAMTRLVSRSPFPSIGSAVGGFGLLFTGIGMLQSGMKGMEQVLTPDIFPPDTWLGRAILVLLGIAVTIVTHSSSAGVALALTAVSVGNITLSQAAALVIGMDVGTTVTAMMASIGGNVNAVRTGLSHVVFNIATAVGAFVLLPLFVVTYDRLFPGASQQNPEIALVSFHTTFNVLGAMVFLPFTNRFAALITYFVPSRTSHLTSRLDPSLIHSPSSALSCVHKTLSEISGMLFRELSQALRASALGTVDYSAFRRKLDEVDQAIRETRTYMNDIKRGEADRSYQQKHAACLHALDHLARLTVRLGKGDRMRTIREDSSLAEFALRLTQILNSDLPHTNEIDMEEANLQMLWNAIDERVEPYRREVIERAAAGEATINSTISQLDSIRWLRRIAYHCWRIVHHLQESDRTQQATDNDQLIDDDA
jgi:phosphate:Na+ symporter